MLLPAYSLSDFSWSPGACNQAYILLLCTQAQHELAGEAEGGKQLQADLQATTDKSSSQEAELEEARAKITALEDSLQRQQVQFSPHAAEQGLAYLLMLSLSGMIFCVMMMMMMMQLPQSLTCSVSVLCCSVCRLLRMSHHRLC